MMDPLRIALRAYSEPKKKRKHTGTRRPQLPRWPGPVLVFDIETTVDPRQKLLFGSYGYYRWRRGRLTLVTHGLLHADDLSESDPEGFATLQAYVERHNAEALSTGAPDLRLCSRREFNRDVFYYAAVRSRGLVGGFNLPFDLTRIACDVGEARGAYYYGGFSLSLFEYFDEDSCTWRRDVYKPRVCMRIVDSKRAFMGFTGVTRRHPRDKNETTEPIFRGHFLDVRTLAFALTGESHSLASACKAFGVETGKGQTQEHGVITPDYIDYNRQDVAATACLLEKLRQEFDRHPVDLRPVRAYSPASISKAYLGALGLRPPRTKFDSVKAELLGYAMSAYFGGRAEVRIRRTPVPVVYLDFLSMYPTVNTLMKLWDLLTAASVEVVDVTDEAQALLDELSPDACFDPATWPKLTFFAEVQPEGDMLPVRGEYDTSSPATTIGVNRLTSDHQLWYAGPDLAASKLLTGKSPRVARAFQLVSHGKQEGLGPVDLGGSLPVDSVTQDFFKTVIETRKGLSRSGLPKAEQARLGPFLKVLANSGSYGIFAEMNRQDRPESRSETVRVHGSGKAFDHETVHPELPGRYAFPPMAALITAAARLMLALLEQRVTAAGGSYAACDTDSMMIVASPGGGLVPCPGGHDQLPDGREAVRALSFKQVEDIRSEFARLNPYDQEIIPGSVLEVEKENFVQGEQTELWCHAISAKRYALYRYGAEGGIEVVKPSEHGLGQLLNPIDPDDPATDWIEELWRYLLSVELDVALVRAPVWLSRPAVSRLTVSSPHLLKPFEALNEGTAYADQVKPMNFMLIAPTARLGTPPGADPARFTLVAPYTSDPSEWLSMDWINRYTGIGYPVTTSHTAHPTYAWVKSYRDVFMEYRYHAEVKSAGPDGTPCAPQTRGLLQRRQVEAVGVYHVGKESNELEHVKAELYGSWDEVREVYESGDEYFLKRVAIPRLKLLRREVVSREIGVTPRQVSALCNGHAEPSTETRERILQLAREFSGQSEEFVS